jgi:ATP-dependent DNA ligase
MAAMPKDLFCIPTAKTAVPAGPDLIHEVKYDGYRVRVERNGDRVRLLSKGGLDWTKRYPWIVETARKIRKSRFILDGEAVVLGVDGISDFDALHSRQHDEEVQLYAFDCLAYNGDDLTRLPLHLRKTNLEQLLRGRSDGIFVAPFEQTSSRERSDQTCSTPPAACSWRASSQSTVSARTASAGASTRVADQF